MDKMPKRKNNWSWPLGKMALSRALKDGDLRIPFSFQRLLLIQGIHLWVHVVRANYVTPSSMENFIINNSP